MAKSKYEAHRDELLAALAVYPSDKTACKAAGVSHQALYSWMRQHPAFSDEVQRARKNRRVALVARMAQESDWRAWEASIKHGPKVLDADLYRRKLAAEAAIAEANQKKAEAEAVVAEALANKAGSGGFMVVGIDGVLDLLANAGRADLADDLEQALAKAEAARMGWRRDILPQADE